MEKDHTTPVASPDRLLRRARLATFAFFGLNGFVMGVWVVHIPAVEDRAGVSHAVLGWLLLLMGAGAFAGLQLCGPLSDRFGARRTVPAAGLLCAGTLVLPGLAGDMTALTAAMVVLGFANGCMDVSMNTHAVQVERGYGRPVMSAFHAVFSVGGVAAALVGARTISWGWSVPLTLGSVGVLGALTALAAAPLLLPPEPGRGEPDSVTPDDAAAPGSADRDHAAADTAGKPAARQPAPRPAKPRTPRRVWGMALLALILMLSEGVAYDWSVLHVQEVLDAPAATAALAYGCFATAMTVGRFTTDRIAARFGPVFVVRYGAGTAAVGLTVVALAPFIPLALVGWTVFGIGLSGCAPQFFSAAGHVDRDASGANVSRVAGLGYMGMLAGPAIIGPMTHLMPLNLTFFLPVAFCVTAVFTAQILRPPSRVASGSGTPAARRGTESAVERSA
ncbi:MULTISPECIES: MFS transporter [unclassified Streptomyces]|uniref:MFS transporter n=1 Tax=unclassified Streptomyces TaxID=2593676 RepID=UPI000BF7E249|nr:MFS transporter [Streptomyces sp. Ru87]PGH47600.1 MFS transporter [Streptomyces sp. Ru87]